MRLLKYRGSVLNTIVPKKIKMFSDNIDIFPESLSFYKDFEDENNINATYSIGNDIGTFTASRSSTSPSTYIDDRGMLQKVIISNIPRINKKMYNNEGILPSKGVILESSSTNIFRSGVIDTSYSNWSDNNLRYSTTARWNLTLSNGGAVTTSISNDSCYLGSAKIVITNEGTVSSDIIFANVNTVNLNNSLPYVLSFWVKTNIVKTIQVVSILSSDGVTNSGLDAIFITKANTWVRITLPFTAVASAGASYIRFLLGLNGTYDIYLESLQLEQGSIATTFIPTTNNSLTRNAEFLQYKTSKNRTTQEETIIIKFMPFSDMGVSSTDRYLLSSSTKSRNIRNVASAGCLKIYPNATDNSSVVASSNTTCAGFVSTVFAGTLKHISPYSKSYIDGEEQGIYTAGDWTNPSWGGTFYIGSSNTGGNQLNGVIQRVAIFNKALSNSDILEISDIFKPFVGSSNSYYVDTTGKDYNRGTIDEPFLTLSKASITAMPGDTVYIKEGTYNERFLVNRSGRNGYPIAYVNYDNDVVTIDNSTVVDSFIDQGSNIWLWSNPTALYTYNVIKDNVFLTRVNTVEELISEDVWFRDVVGNNYQIMLYSTTDPNLSTIKVVSTTSIVELNGRQYVNITGVNIAYGYDGYRSGYSISSKNIQWANCTASYCYRGWMIIGEGAYKSNCFRLTNCTASYCNNHGFKVAQNTTYDGTSISDIIFNLCISHDNGEHGFQSSNGSSDIHYYYCTAYNNNLLSYEGGTGFRFGSTDGGSAIGCSSYGNTQYGMTVDHSDGMTRGAQNIVIEKCVFSGDSIGVHIYDVSEKNIIRNNIIRNTLGSYGGINIGLSSNQVIYNNHIFDNIPNNILISSSCNSINIKNNIIRSEGNNYCIKFSGELNGTISDYNNIYKPSGDSISYNGQALSFTDYQNNTLQDIHSISGDALLDKVTYTIDNLSPCKDSGIVLEDITDDYFGTIRPITGIDIGAHEISE